MKKKFQIRIIKEDNSAAYSDTDFNLPTISNGCIEKTLSSVTIPPHMHTEPFCIRK